MLDGEVRTLRELGVGNGASLTVRILSGSSPSHSFKLDAKDSHAKSDRDASSKDLLASSSSALHALTGGGYTHHLSKHAALPGMMIAQSSHTSRRSSTCCKPSQSAQRS